MSVTVTLARQQLRGIGRDVKFRLLPALHDHRGDAVQPVQARLDLIGRHLPQLGLRHAVGGQAVADDGKLGEGQAMRFDLRGGGKLRLHPRNRRVHVLQGLEHVHVPAEITDRFRRSRGW